MENTVEKMAGRGGEEGGREEREGEEGEDSFVEEKKIEHSPGFFFPYDFFIFFLVFFPFSPFLLFFSLPFSQKKFISIYINI